MALDRLTKVDGGGISTTSDYRVGIITASKFVGPFDGTGGNFSGVVTATNGVFSGNISAVDGNFSGNVTIGGTLTYEDVTNIDSVGIITAQKDIHVGAGVSAVGVGTFGQIKVGTGITIGTAGVGTFTSVQAIDSFASQKYPTTKISFPTNSDHLQIFTSNTQRMRFYAAGTIFIGAEAQGPSGNAALYLNRSSTSVFSDSSRLYDQPNHAMVHIKNYNPTGGGEAGIVLHNDNGGAGVVAIYGKKRSSYISDCIFRFRDSGSTSVESFRVRTTDIQVGTGVTIETNGQATYTGIVTATSFVGSGANLTSLPAQVTIANNADNRVITGGSGVNLNGESTFTYDGSLLTTEKRMVIGNGSEFQIPSRSNTSSYTPQFQVTGAWNNPTHGATMALNGRTDYPILWLNSGASYQDNSGCGVITWSIKDGAGNYCNTAEIRSFVDGTPGNNDSPGDLSFRTTPAGTCQSTEKLRIASNGLITATQSNSTIGLIVKNSAHDSQLQILATASNKNSVIFFGDAGDDDIGQIDYDHNDNSLSFTVNTSERLRIDSAGRLLIAKGDASTTTSQIQIGDPTSGYTWDVGDTPQVLIAGVNNESPTSGTLNIALRVADENNNNMFQIHNRGGGNTDVGQVYVAGKFGINVLNPQAKLQANDTAPVIAEFYRSDGGTNDEARIALGALSSNIPSQRGVLLTAVNNGAGHDFSIRTSPNHSLGPTQKVLITSGGEVLVGTPNKVNTSPSKFQVAATDATGSAIFARFNANSYSSYLDFYKSRSNTLGTAYVVNNNDHLGALRFYGADGSNSGYTTAAEIYGSCDGGSGSSGDMPGRITFHTRPDGAGQSMQERLRIKSNGLAILGNVSNTGGVSNAALHIESAGMNVESGYDTDDVAGNACHLTLSGQSTRVRMDFGTLNNAPYAGFIQARFDNNPFGNSGSDDGLEPLLLNPRGGVLSYNCHDSAATGNVGGGNASAYGGFVMRAGRANSSTVNNNSTAIKIYPAEIRDSSIVGEQNQGAKFGGIAWHGLDPHNGGWNGYGGHHCWMGMSYHSTPGQEFSNWQVQMNNNTSPGSYATNIALQASPQGYVTKPSQPIFLAHKTDGVRITGTGYVTFGQVHINNGSHYDSSNGRFTAPIAGHYFFYTKINAYNRLDMQLRVNGRTTNVDREYGQYATDSDSVGWWSNLLQRHFYLDKNEYVQVYISSLGQNTDPGAWNTFGGWLVA